MIKRIKRIVLILGLGGVWCNGLGQNPQLLGATFDGGMNAAGVLFKINGDGTGFTNVHSFIDSSGSNPYCGLLNANDGKIYGITYMGGINLYGVLFSFDPTNNIYTDLFNFNDSAYGGSPITTPIQLSNNLLYSMTSGGGVNNVGIIYSFNPYNNTINKIYDFDQSNGFGPSGSLMQANNGLLYGMTGFGGASNEGVIYSFDTTNNSYIKLFDFDGLNGSEGSGNFIQLSNGKLYGMTTLGGINNKGVIFNFDIANNTYTKLYDFVLPDGGQPFGSLIQASNGKLYGLSSQGGIFGSFIGYGVIFSFDPLNNTYSKLYDFDLPFGIYPYFSLIEASNGKLYGMTIGGGAYGSGVIFEFDPSSNAYIKIHDFDYTNGGAPQGDLIELLPTGINTNGLSKSIFNIFPNPTTGTIQLTFNTKHNAPMKCEIINVMGERVISSPAPLTPKGEPARIQLDVSFLAKGIYVVRVGNENRKLVVE